VFEVVGVDLPIKVSLTSGAGVIVVFAVIVGAIWMVMFVLFNSIESAGVPSCADIHDPPELICMKEISLQGA
jgi:hypothetical protein